MQCNVHLRKLLNVNNSHIKEIQLYMYLLIQRRYTKTSPQQPNFSYSFGARSAGQWRIQEGEQIRPWPPHRSWQWTLALPFGGRKNNDSIVKLAKCKDFAPPYRCRLR